MDNEEGSLDALVQEKMDSDEGFSEEIANLSEEEKEEAITSKKSEILTSHVAELKDKASKASKAEELASNYKLRAEKAEQELKKHKGADEPAGEPTPTKQELSQTDVIILARAEIHQDDIEEVIEYAKFKGITVSEALTSDVMKSTLETRKEFRETREATNTRKTGASAKSPSGDELIKNLKKGEVPEKGSKEAEELFWAKRGGKR